jgi:CHAD domain-containing protein
MSTDPPDNRSYRLRADEQAADGLRRIARGRIVAAVERLRAAGDDDLADAIHDARKDMKKLRSLLRLVRDDLGKQRYRAANARYRDAARELSPARDAEVKLATLTALRASHPDNLPRATALQQALERERAELAAAGTDVEQRVDAAAEAIAAGAIDVDAWTLHGDDFDLLRSGLERCYRRGRDRMRTARDRPSDEAIHEWRKRTKDLWYQLRLLRNAWPELLGPTAEQAHELADLLGDHNDLAVLIADARRRLPDDPDTAALAVMAEHRQAELLERAFALGDRLYAEQPARFAKRLGRYWEAWRTGA